MPASISSRLFIALVMISGCGLIVKAAMHAGSDNPVQFISFLLIACVAARLKVKLPGVTGNMSVNLPFILVVVAQMSSAEALAVGCLSTVVQCLPRSPKKLNWVQLVFNFSNMALAISATRWLYNSTALGSAIESHALLLGVAAAGFFAVNSIPVAIVIALTEGKNPFSAWAAMFQLSYPYFLASAAVAGVVLTVSAHAGWQVPALLLPLMAGIFYSYRRYFATAFAQTELKHAPQSVKAMQAVG